MDIDRRTFLAGLGVGFFGGLLASDAQDGDLDTPYRASGFTMEQLDRMLEPGEPVPEEITDALMPEDYQEYIDPSFDAELEELVDVPYHRDIMDWKRPDRYMAEGGDCEDYATAAASVLEREGIENQVVIGSLDGVGHTATEDAAGNTYTVGAGSTHLAEWTPVLAFSKDRGLHAYDPDWSR